MVDSDNIDVLSISCSLLKDLSGRNDISRFFTLKLFNLNVDTKRQNNTRTGSTIRKYVRTVRKSCKLVNRTLALSSYINVMIVISIKRMASAIFSLLSLYG